MKIVELNTENFKRIKVVDITPKGDVVILEGRNAQGKSSIMDSISAVLCGEKMIPLDPVRKGTDRAEITVDLGDVVVKRTWKKGKDSSTLEIKTKDGEKVQRAQEYLNERLKVMTFDPSMFIRMKPTERVEELKKIPGLDCSAEDAAYLVEYDKRTLINRDMDKAKKSLDSEYKGIVAPKNLRTVAQIQKDIDAMEEKNKGVRAHNSEVANKQAELEKAGEKFAQSKADITQTEVDAAQCDEAATEAQEAIVKAEEEIKRLRAKIEDAKKQKVLYIKKGEDLKKISAEWLETGRALSAEVEASMVLQEFSNAKLKEELLAASEVSGVTAKLERKAELESEVDYCEDQVKAIELIMAEIKERKRAKLAAFKLPVKGLEVGERDIMFDGIPFDNLSQAQKIMVSMALAIAEKPDIRIIKVTEGSLFDKETLQVVIDFAKSNDFQIWIERVANTPSGDAIFIEDGEVVK